jgi:hypothetical protein
MGITTILYSCVCEVGQVIPDWRGGNQDKPGKLTKAAKGAVRKRHEALMGKQDVGKGKKSTGPPTVKQERLANKYNALSGDAGIRRGVGVRGYQSFQHQQRSKRLTSGRKRFFVAKDDLPEDLKAKCAKRTRRSAIEAPGEDAFLEVLWAAPRPILFQATDMGSIGWVFKRWLFAGPDPIHGFYDPDPPHRRNDNVDNALRESQTGWAKQEILLIHALTSAPFGGSAHFRTIQEVAAELFDVFAWDSDYFMVFYPKLVFQFSRGKTPLEFGTAEHMKRSPPFCLESFRNLGASTPWTSSSMCL